jgi:hypothetical protein
VKAHRLDPISLLLGIAALAVGIAAINGRLGNLINNRPDALIPLLILGTGAVAVLLAARRILGEGTSQPVEPDQ